MRYARPLLHCLALAAITGGCAAAARAPAEPTLAQRLDAIFDAPPLHRTSWGVVVRERGSGQVLYARNPERHFIPASNTKLVVTTAALGLLGPEWRYRTPLYVRTLPGDSVAAELRIVGTGDPTFSARFWERPLGTAQAMAETIAAAGIRRIQALTVDASRFTDAAVNGTWEVGDLPGTSAPPTGAFAFDEGVFRLELRGGASAGSEGTATQLLAPAAPGAGEPQPMRGTVVTDTAGAPTRTSSDMTARRDTIYFAARVGAGKLDTVRLAMTDAPAYAARALAHALAARGVQVDSVRVLRAGEPTDTVDLTRLGELDSPPLADIVAAILQPSQNWIAEQLLKTLGAERGAGGSWSAGLAVERRYLVDVVKLDSLAFNLRDASGLSAQNLITPAATVQLLEHARAAAWGERYRMALPTPGQTGGTLANRLPALAQRLHAKTGTISNVNSLAGFLDTDDGRELTFSIMSNGSGLPSATVRAAIDSAVATLARARR